MKLYIVVFVCLMPLTSAAQQPAQPTAPSAPRSSVPVQVKAGALVDPEQGGQPINIRLDVTVTDQAAQGAPQPKSLMVILADRAMGRTRAAFQDRSIAVDARPTVVEDRIRVNVTIQSSRPASFGPPQPTDDFTIDWRNSFSLLLENAKPMLALETTDATTKRRMSIEVMAKIQK